MANQLESFTATFDRTPLTKGADWTRLYLPIPRSIVNFTVNAGVIGTKPLNDTQELVVVVNLPIEFAYRMVDLLFTIDQDVAHDWNTRGFFTVINGIRRLPAGQRQRHILVSNEYFGRSPFVEQSAFTFDQMPRYIFQAVFPKIQPVLAANANNLTAAAGAAGELMFYASFLEYDLEQVQNVNMHIPGLTYERS